MKESISSVPSIYSLRKTNQGVVARLDGNGQPEAVAMRWGFHRSFNPAINNARGDRLKSAMWRDAWREKRRGLIPVKTFYDWKGSGKGAQTYAFRAQTGWLWVAGLWEESETHGVCFTMILDEANVAVAKIHSRMPVILPEDRLDEFLREDDPIELIEPSELSLEIFPCENPLKLPTPSPPIPAKAVQLDLL